MGTEPGGKLNCATKEIVMLLDWFARGSTNSDFDGAIALVFRVFGQVPLNLSCTFHRRGGRHERRHNAVASMFNLATAQISQGVSDNSVVNVEQAHRCLIAQCLR